MDAVVFSIDNIIDIHQGYFNSAWAIWSYVSEETLKYVSE